VIAVRARAEAAIERARAGEGPTLIEAITYRLTDHTTADDASRYREDEQVKEHWKKEPIARLRTFLAETEVWTKADEEALLSETREKVDAAVEEYEALAPDTIEAMFDHTFADLPPDLAAQRSAALAALEE
jgi:pyruvate dehydrogenase E1 component alpha subunit